LQKAAKLVLVGIGYRPLSERASAIVRNAEVLLASTRLLEVFKRYAEYEGAKDRIKVIDKVPETIAFIQDELRTSNSKLRTIVLLASGDPLFFGIGRRMIEEFGAEQVEIIPDLSSMQEAFSRINLPWDDAFCISVHGGPDIAKRRALPYEMTDIPWLLEKHGKLAILTDKQNNPAEIGKIVGSEIVMHVCERIGYSDERIWTGTAGEARELNFRDPNVVILLKQGVRSGDKEATFFGLRESEIQHDQGMITKDEVRAVTIHKLRLPRKAVLWDIGAGSGSVSLEAARLSQDICVFSIEKEAFRVEMIKRNAVLLGISNVRVIHGAAPEALESLPVPDRVFIGGSTSRLDEIVDVVSRSMQKGIVVINAATLETLRDGVASLERCGYVTEVSEISVSRSRSIAGKKLMNALNPVFIMKGEKA